MGHPADEIIEYFEKIEEENLYGDPPDPPEGTSEWISRDLPKLLRRVVDTESDSALYAIEWKVVRKNGFRMTMRAARDLMTMLIQKDYPMGIIRPVANMIDWKRTPKGGKYPFDDEEHDLFFIACCDIDTSLEVIDFLYFELGFETVDRPRGSDKLTPLYFLLQRTENPATEVILDMIENGRVDLERKLPGGLNYFHVSLLGINHPKVVVELIDRLKVDLKAPIEGKAHLDEWQDIRFSNALEMALVEYNAPLVDELIQRGRVELGEDSNWGNNVMDRLWESIKDFSDETREIIAAKTRPPLVYLDVSAEIITTAIRKGMDWALVEELLDLAEKRHPGFLEDSLAKDLCLELFRSEEGLRLLKRNEGTLDKVFLDEADQEVGQEVFLRACRYGILPLVKALVDRSPDVAAATDPSGCNALIEACSSKKWENPELVRYLCRRNQVDVNLWAPEKKLHPFSAALIAGCYESALVIAHSHRFVPVSDHLESSLWVFINLYYEIEETFREPLLGVLLNHPRVFGEGPQNSDRHTAKACAMGLPLGVMERIQEAESNVTENPIHPLFVTVGCLVNTENQVIAIHAAKKANVIRLAMDLLKNPDKLPPLPALYIKEIRLPIALFPYSAAFVDLYTRMMTYILDSILSMDINFDVMKEMLRILFHEVTEAALFDDTGNFMILYVLFHRLLPGYTSRSPDGDVIWSSVKDGIHSAMYQMTTETVLRGSQSILCIKFLMNRFPKEVRDYVIPLLRQSAEKNPDAKKMHDECKEDYERAKMSYFLHDLYPHVTAHLSYVNSPEQRIAGSTGSLPPEIASIMVMHLVPFPAVYDARDDFVYHRKLALMYLSRLSEKKKKKGDPGESSGKK